MYALLKTTFAVMMASIAISSCTTKKTSHDNSTSPKKSSQSSTEPPATLKGRVTLDGSSTVYPMAEAAAEEFGKKESGVQVTVAVSGTGGGFKRFCSGEINITSASRPIKPSEITACASADITYIEIPIAVDGTTLIINPKNTWAHTLTTSELKKIWSPNAENIVTMWSDIRPDWPKQPFKLFGPGPDSGTFDSFTKVIVGKERASRTDYFASEDDNMVVRGVQHDLHSLGYLGYAYFDSNRSTLKAVSIDPGTGIAVEPNKETIRNGTYKPLSRPVFIYVHEKSLVRAEVSGFLKFWIENAGTFATEVGYVRLTESYYNRSKERVAKSVTGSLFAREGGLTLEQWLKITTRP